MGTALLEDAIHVPNPSALPRSGGVTSRSLRSSHVNARGILWARSKSSDKVLPSDELYQARVGASGEGGAPAGALAEHLACSLKHVDGAKARPGRVALVPIRRPPTGPRNARVLRRGCQGHVIGRPRANVLSLEDRARIRIDGAGLAPDPPATLEGFRVGGLPCLRDVWTGKKRVAPTQSIRNGPHLASARR